jgi:hypothetical protein
MSISSSTWPFMARHKKPFIITLIAFGVVGVGFVVLAPSPRITEPSVSFIGYTHDASGGRRGMFAITNRATQALDMLLSPHHSVEGRVTGLERLAPRATIIASVTAVERPDPLPWRAAFTFLPARAPLSYRVKMRLYQAGVRSLDMSLPSVTVTTDLIQ